MRCSWRTRGRPAMPKHWRYEIAARDGAICALCGKPLDIERATLDHIIPRGAGGPDHPDNLQLAHFRCNVRRGRSGATRAARMAARDGYPLDSAENRGQGGGPA
jgi:5-methylcytosine-specific restriction endonuclease McrA